MKVTRTVEISKNDLVRFLMEKMNIKAHLIDIECTVVSDRSSKGELETLKLEWVEGFDQTETWNR